MYLIADGGSTKCDWVVIDNSGNVIIETITKGLNPSVFQEETLLSRLNSNQALFEIKDQINHLSFFGLLKLPQ